MNTKITLDMLTNESVSIKKQNYMTVDGTEYAIGEPYRKAYENSQKGRIELQNELEEPYLSATLSVWGVVPTIEEPEVEIL